MTAVAFQGAWTDVTLTEGGQDIRLQLPGTVHPHMGETLSFGLEPHNIIRLGDA